MFIPRKNEAVVYCSGAMTRFKIVIVKDVYINIQLEDGGIGYFLLDEFFTINGNIATYVGGKHKGFGVVTNGEAYVIDSYDVMIDGAVILEGEYIKSLSEYRVDIIDNILN